MRLAEQTGVTLSGGADQTPEMRQFRFAILEP